MKKNYEWRRGTSFDYTIYQDGTQLDPAVIVLRLQERDEFRLSAIHLFDALTALTKFDDHKGLGLDHSFDCDIYDPRGRSTCDCGFCEALAHARGVLEEERDR